MRARETRRIKAMAGALLIASLATAASAGPLDGSLPIIQRSKYDPQTEFQAGMAALSDQKFAEAKSDFEHVLSVAQIIRPRSTRSASPRPRSAI